MAECNSYEKYSNGLLTGFLLLLLAVVTLGATFNGCQTRVVQNTQERLDERENEAVKRGHAEWVPGRRAADFKWKAAPQATN